MAAKTKRLKWSRGRAKFGPIRFKVGMSLEGDYDVEVAGPGICDTGRWTLYSDDYRETVEQAREWCENWLTRALVVAKTLVAEEKKP